MSTFLLDMDETLLDFTAAERQNLSETFSGAGIPPTEELVSRFHAINDELWRALERGEIERERLKVKRFELLLQEMGSKASAEELSRRYYTNFLHICVPFAGAKEFLAELKRRGRVFILTNGGTDIQKAHIAAAGFSPYLEGVFISEEIGANKPSEGYVRYVKEHIEGFDPAHTMYLGDSLTSDMVCAKRLGVDFILFAPHTMPASYTGAAVRTYRSALALMK